MTIQYTIKKRPGYGEPITVTIDQLETAAESMKLGEAVKAAFKSGADLGGADLRGADLRGADLGGACLGGADLRGAYLGGADLRGADLRGACLRGADLRGADLRGAYLGEKGDKTNTIKSVFARVTCIESGYEWLALEMEEGPYKIKAGCRYATAEDFATRAFAEYGECEKWDGNKACLAFIASEAVRKGVASLPTQNGGVE